MYKWGDIIVAEFKDRLEQAMRMRNIKPSELAKLTSIGEGAISQYRKGAYKASQRNLEKISRVLEVSIPWLMGCDDENPTLPKEDGVDDLDKQLIQLLPIMSRDQKELLLAQIETTIKRRKESQTFQNK